MPQVNEQIRAASVPVCNRVGDGGDIVDARDGQEIQDDVGAGHKQHGNEEKDETC